MRTVLQTAVGAWYAASGFRAATFRSRFFDPYTDDAVTDRLRSAARGIVDADNHAELGAASKDLATAALAVGVDRWPRFVGTAARHARTAVGHGEVPGAILAPDASREQVYAAAGVAGATGAAAAPGSVLVPLGRVLVPILEAAPPIAAGLAVVTLAVWVKKYGTVTTAPVQGFGPADRGVAPISADVNANTHTVRLYHGSPDRTPDTATQHTVELRLGEDGTLTDKDGRTVGRLTADRQVIPMQGVDIPGLFHGPAATPPGGRDPGKTLPPSPGTSTTSEADRKSIEQPEARPVAAPAPNATGTPVPVQAKGANVLPGRKTTPALPQNNERWGDGSPEKVDHGHQDKHIPGTRNDDPRRSPLTADAQTLLDAHSGKSQPVGPAQRGQPGFREVFDTGGPAIGSNVDPKTGTSTPTTRGTIHYSGKGAHIVPAIPR